MSTKETIVKLLQDQGYDVLTACEIANDAIKEAWDVLQTSNPYRFSIGDKVYEIRNRELPYNH